MPTLKTYLNLGYVPFLYEPGARERWQKVCAKLGWPFSPANWEKRADLNAGSQQ